MDPHDEAPSADRRQIQQRQTETVPGTSLPTDLPHQDNTESVYP